MNTKYQDYCIQISTPDQFTYSEDRLSSNNHTWHGAAVMWHASLNSNVLNICNTHDRFTGINMKFDEHSILAISAYLPTCGKDDEFLDCLAELSIFILQNKSETGTVLIGTDSNCSEKSSPRRVQAFKQFCEENNLLKVCCSEPTFHHVNGLSSSNIDYFLISTACNNSPQLKNISMQCNQEHPENLSSHDPVTATLGVPCTEQACRQENFSHTYSDFNQSRVIWKDENIGDYQRLAGKTLTEYESFFPTPEFIPLKCQLYSDLLVKSAEVCLDTKPDKADKKRKHSPQVHQAWQHLRKTFKIWKREGKLKEPDNQNFLNYKLARANVQHVRRYCDNLKTIKANNLLMHSHISDRNKHFKLIKSIRGVQTKKCLPVLYTPTGEYYGSDTLEGFASDAELLGQFVGENEEYDNEFYRLCIQDNSYIFDFKTENCMKIPKMEYDDLEKIISKEMKNGKACDIYKLTAEHLKHAGKEAKLAILKLINDIIDNIYYLKCPQVKAGLGTAVYKGKKKPVAQSSSYRRITVTPQIGSVLDRYIDPLAEEIFRPVQSSDQYGFTKDISYLMAAVLRGECQRWALDKKQTCFGVSFDGKAAFPSVDRDIQVRELYSCGETGDLLQYSRNTYENTACKMKQDGKLSREVREFRGSRQGHKRAAGHFKTYINPCLTAANSPELGFFIGPICISAVCVADDTYILSGDPRHLQDIINIVGHYGRRYRLIFGADKTKVTVTGSKQDMMYYNDINIWSLYGEKLTVSEDNEHLGLIVSGIDEEIKNVDKNIKSARDSLFSFLGNIFSYKCKLSPVVQHHTWSVFIKPVLRSGLSALPIRPPVLKTLTTFHHKILRAVLKLSPYSPLAPLYFLLGELPIEASLHMDVLSLFWNIWSNPQTKSFEVLKYLLKMSDSNSLTWAAHVRILFLMYKLPDPLILLDAPPWPKGKWKHHTQIAITSYHEATLRSKALRNFKLEYLNVQATGLSGRPHPVLSWVMTTRDVVVSRPHIKMLAGDYMCYANLAHDRGLDPHCRVCQVLSHHPAPAENLVHLLTRCRATADTRDRIMPELINTVAKYFPSNRILSSPNHNILTQFILDCSSLNLPVDTRVSPIHNGFISITKECSNLINAIHQDRTRQMKALGLLHFK